MRTQWWQVDDGSKVGTLEVGEVEADVETRDGRTVLVWRWSQDGRQLREVVAGQT